MLSLLTAVVKPLPARYPSLLGVSFEWPRYCDGWDSAKCWEIATLCKFLSIRSDFDGCMYGLRHFSDSHSFLKKPWRIQSNCPELKKLSLTCDGSHPHKPTAGASAVASGMYTVKLVKTLSKLLSVPLAKTIRTRLSQVVGPVGQPPSLLPLRRLPFPRSAPLSLLPPKQLPHP